MKMDLGKLLHIYFDEKNASTQIAVFDNKNIYDVFTRIVKVLTMQPDIEIGVLQALSYCFYEILDNVLIHSEKLCGTAVTDYDASKKKIRILVADDGIGIANSLRKNRIYASISDEQALKQCLLDKVTDGNGMGFGLYSTMKLIEQAGFNLRIHSMNYCLNFDGKNLSVEESECWKGTVIYLEIHSDKDLNPNEIVDDRTDIATEFNEAFLDDNDLENLW